VAGLFIGKVVVEIVEQVVGRITRLTLTEGYMQWNGSMIMEDSENGWGEAQVILEYYYLMPNARLKKMDEDGNILRFLITDDLGYWW